MENPSLIVTADRQIRMQTAPIDTLGPDDVLLHVRATGICGSDIHFWRHGGIGDIIVSNDCILGHEAAAVVVKKGANVTNVDVGDRVAIEPGVSCGKCFLCIDGRYNLCKDVCFSGVYPCHGTIQRFKVHAASHVFRLPQTITFQTAALIEPLSVALHALRTAPITVGTPVAVCGAGPIGLLTLAAARASGAHPIVITDIDASRLEFAKRFEPRCRTYLVSRDHSPEMSARGIRDLFEAEGGLRAKGGNNALHTEYDMPQAVFECTGMETSIATAGYTARRGGTVCVVGVSSRMTIDNVPFMHMSLAEIKLLFINRYHDTWPAAVRAVEGGLINSHQLDMMVTHRFKLEDAQGAMELVGGVAKPSRGEAVVKVQIVDDVDITL